MATTLEDIKPEQDELEELGQEILRASTDEIANRVKLLENDIKVLSP